MGDPDCKPKEVDRADVLHFIMASVLDAQTKSEVDTPRKTGSAMCPEDIVALHGIGWGLDGRSHGDWKGSLGS